MSYHELDIYQPFEFMKYRKMVNESESELETKVKLQGDKKIPIGSNPDLKEGTETSSNNTLIGLAVVAGVALIITFLVLK